MVVALGIVGVIQVAQVVQAIPVAALQEVISYEFIH